MLSYVCFMPCNLEFGEEMGEDFGTSNYTYLYCGAYILTDWEPGAYRVLKRNRPIGISTISILRS